MDRFKFRVWTQYPREPLAMASTYEMERCMLERNYTVVEGVYSCHPEEGYQILEQCTGLKDKNGTLIYEGDILLNHLDQKRAIVFHNSGLGFWHNDEWYPLNSYRAGNEEVLGNIHENPELLNG
jgi:uncharacterized phage protein (TIGR01671 family)